MDIITVEKRNEKLKAKQLRKEGFVPCCVYGGNLPNSISIQMDQNTADRLFRELRLGSKIKLKLDDKIIMTQIKNSTNNLMSNKVDHIDFQALEPEKKVNSVTHIILKNADAVMGVLEKMLLEIPYASLPEDMIDTIAIDLEDKAVGTVMTVGDIPELLNDSIELQVETDSIIFRINEKKNVAANQTEQTEE